MALMEGYRMKRHDLAPPGYTLSKCEVLGAEKPEFRCIAHRPDGKIVYVSYLAESKEELETPEFWKYFWDTIMNGNHNWIEA
jgi:hypothetical protein